MRVLEVVHGFPPSAQGGSEIYAQAHARALHRLGDEILVLTREQDPTRPEYAVRTEEREGIRIVWVNNTFRATRTFEETYRNDTIGAITGDVMDEFKPDVAHVHHLTCLSTTIPALLKSRGIPCFLTLHDYWLMCHRGQLLDVDFRLCDGPVGSGCDRCLSASGRLPAAVFAAAPALRAIERTLPAAAGRNLRDVAGRMITVTASGREADERAGRRLAHMRQVCAHVTHFLAPSRSIRDRFVTFGVARDRITVAGYGFEHAPFARVERSLSPRLRIGFLGSLMVSKAPHVLLEAFARLPRGAASVSLFGGHAAYHGDDRYRQQLEPLLSGEGVRWQGAIEHERVAAALASIDVLVVPSIWPENSPLVIQEAFLAGVPVVASRIGGIPEVVADGRNGLLFVPGSVADLHRVLSRLLDEPSLLATLRAGIPPVLTIEEDVALARGLYEASLSASLTPHAPARPRLAAIVLNYRTPHDTLLAVRSLVASRRPIDDLIVVDNHPIDDRCQELTADVAGLTYLRTDENLGFSGGMNVGIRAALARGADAVLFVNSDAIVPPDCIALLERCLDATTHAGIAGPVLRSRSDPELIASAGMRYAPRSGRMRHRSFGERRAARSVQPDQLVDGASGCVMLVRRQVFDSIGLLDEDYFFSFEDLDFCLKARRAGFVSVVAGAATAYHEGGRSIGSDSTQRLYFAARNHLWMAWRAGGSVSPPLSTWRAISIVTLNLAHAIVSSGGSLPLRLRAVWSGTADYVRGRLGTDRNPWSV